MNAAERLEVNMKASTNQEVRIALLEQSIGHIGETLIRIDNRLNAIDSKMDKKFDEMDRKLDKFDARLWTNFYWILGTVFTLSSVLAGLMAKGFNWFS